MYYFKRLIMKDCVGDDTGYLRMVRSGGMQLNQADISMTENYDRIMAITNFIQGADQRKSVFDDEYMKNLLPNGINLLGSISVTSSEYTGDAENDSFYFTFSADKYQVSP